MKSIVALICLLTAACCVKATAAGGLAVSNLVSNGSFELSATGDQPDLIYNDLGASWCDSEWRVKRVPCKTAPHGGFVFRIAGRYRYRSMPVKTSGKRMYLAFSARMTSGEGAVKWRFGSQSGSFAVTESWRRCEVEILSAGTAKLEMASADGESLELDAVVLSEQKVDDVWIPSMLDVRYTKECQSASNRRRSTGVQRQSFCDDGRPAHPPVVELLEPDVRYSLMFAGETNCLRGMVFRDGGTVCVKNAKSEVVLEKAVEPAELDEGVFFGERLPVGNYEVRLHLRNIGIGQSRPRHFKIVSRPSAWCRMDRFAHIAETEGGAFVPFGIAMSHAEGWTNRFAEVKSCGYNSVYFWSYSGDETRRFDVSVASAVFDHAYRCGLDVVTMTPYLTSASAKALTNGIPRPKVMDVQFSEVLKAKCEFVSALKSHPALRMWNHYDELYNYWWSGKYPKTDKDVYETYRVVGRLDPCHVQWNNSVWIARNEVTGGAAATDFAVGTVYTLHGVEGVCDTISEASRLARLGHPDSHNMPPAAGIWLPYYAAYGESGPLAHEPSAGEIRALLYGSLIRGVRGFWFYNYRPTSDNLWRSGGECAREISSMADVFLRGKHLGAEVDSPDIEAMAYQCGGDVYVLSVNTSSERLCARIKLPEGCRRGRTSGLFEDRSVLFKNYILTDEWEPYARHIYKIGRNKNLSYE